MTKKINWTYPLIAFLFLIILTAAPVFAAGKSDIIKAIEKMVKNMVNMGATTKAIEILTVDVAEKYPEVWSNIVMPLVETAIVPISYSVLCIYFVAALVSTAIKFDTLTPEMIVKPMIQFVAAIILVKATPKLLVIGTSIGGNFAKGFSVSISQAVNVDETAKGVMNAIKPAVTGIPSGISVYLELMLPNLATYLIGMLIQIICYAVIIEIFIRAVLMPLSFGSIVTQGMLGPGFRFFKSFLACCLQAGAMVLICIICGQFVGNDVWSAAVTGASDFVGRIGKTLVIEGACVILMFKAGTFTREALGL